MTKIWVIYKDLICPVWTYARNLWKRVWFNRILLGIKTCTWNQDYRYDCHSLRTSIVRSYSLHLIFSFFDVKLKIYVKKVSENLQNRTIKLLSLLICIFACLDAHLFPELAKSIHPLSPQKDISYRSIFFNVFSHIFNPSQNKSFDITRIWHELFATNKLFELIYFFALRLWSIAEKMFENSNSNRLVKRHIVNENTMSVFLCEIYR